MGRDLFLHFFSACRYESAITMRIANAIPAIGVPGVCMATVLAPTVETSWIHNRCWSVNCQTRCFLF